MGGTSGGVRGECVSEQVKQLNKRCKYCDECSILSQKIELGPQKNTLYTITKLPAGR